MAKGAATTAESEPESSDVSVLLEEMDKINFSSPKDDKKLEQLLKQLNKMDKRAHGKMKRYVADQDNKYYKYIARMKVFRAICMDLSHDEATEYAIGIFSGDKDDNFVGCLANWMDDHWDERFREVLRRTVNDPNMGAMSQVCAARALARRGDDSGKEVALRSILQAESGLLIGMEALGLLEARDVLPRLHECAERTDVKTAASAHFCLIAILRIEMGRKSSRKQVRILRDSMLKEADYLVHKWAAEQLVKIGDERAMRALIYVNEKDPGNIGGVKGILMGIEEGRWTREDLERYGGGNRR